MLSYHDQNCNLPLLQQTRRQFFRDCGVGLGSIALATLIGKDSAQGAGASALLTEPLAVRPGHFPARAKRVIYLFMAGGPSQLELFDYKPKLVEMSGKPIQQSFLAGQRFAF